MLTHSLRSQPYRRARLATRIGAALILALALGAQTASAASITLIVDSAGNVGGYTSLALDAIGSPVISYYDFSNGDLKLAHCNGPICWGDGISVTVDSTGDVGRYTSLALDAGGNPVISYNGEGNNQMKLVHCDDPRCTDVETPVTVDTAGGLDTALVLDTAGNPVISYYDLDSFKLKLARCDDANCAARSIQTINESELVYGFASLALDGSGNPVISYHTYGALKLAHCNDPGCDPALPAGNGGESIQTVDDTVIASWGYTSLALDTAGNPVISYYDSRKGLLKLAHCNDQDCNPVAGGSESLQIVDNGLHGTNTMEESAYTSLELNTSGFPIISYYDVAKGDLKLAHCNDPDCNPAVSGAESLQVVDQTGDVGRWASLALHTSGEPIISYYDSSNGDLRLAHCDTVTCGPVTLTVAGSGGGSGTMQDGWLIHCVWNGSATSDICSQTSSSPTLYEITATASTGSTFDHWEGCDWPSEQLREICYVTPRIDRTVTVFFTQDCYTLSVGANPPASGTASASTAQNCSGGYTYGTVVTVSATAKPGYTFAGWSGDASGSANPTTVTMDGNKSVTADFSQDCYTLTTSPNPSEGGAASASTAENCSGGYTYGTVVSIGATANSGYTFAGWSGDASGTANPTTITMDGNKSVTADFALLPPVVCPLANCSFESAAGVNLRPDAWKSRGIKTPGDGTDRTVFVDEAQSFRFSNPKARAKKLWQELKIVGPAGTSLALTFSMRGDNVTGKKGLSRVIVYQYYARGGRGKFIVNLPTGTTGWTAYNLPFAAKKAFKKLRVEIYFGKKGTAWFDDFGLTVN